MSEDSTHARLSDEELTEIEARANAATPGPWKAGYVTVFAHGRPMVTEDRRRSVSGETVVFIAHARTDVPRLLAEVRALRAEVASLTRERDEAITKERAAAAPLTDEDRARVAAYAASTQELVVAIRAVIGGGSAPEIDRLRAAASAYFGGEEPSR